jgi:electron transport complex protein RnfE
MSRKPKAIAILKNGIFDENPIFRMLLGMCPMLAVTTAAVNGIGMGAASMFVLIGSNVVIALLRNFIPPKIRIPAFIVIIATFVTLVQFLLKAYVPSLDKSLGIFIPLIVVNCIILGRAEAFSSKNTVWHSFVDAIGMGLGFTVALVIVASIREILGNGTFFDIVLFGDRFEPALIMVGAPGAFITLGLVLALINHISKKRRQRQTKGAR